MLGTAAKRQDSSSNHENEFLLRYEFLFHRCLRLTGERNTAKDLLHDAYVQFVVNRPNLDDIRDINNYLIVMVRNLYVSEMRLARSRKTAHVPIADFDSAAMALRSNR